MADKTTTELERVYTIPLRKTKDLVRSRRADLAVRDVKRFLSRHMKSEEIWIDADVNQHLWSRGKFKIPSRIRVRATRFSDGVVEVTLPETEHAGSVRQELAERREKAAESPVLTGPKEAAEEAGPGTDRPVTEIAGIGPATAEKLEKAEIENLHDLAEADPEQLAKDIGYAVDKVAPWVEEAKKLVGPAKKADEAKAEAPAASAATPPAAEPAAKPEPKAAAKPKSETGGTPKDKDKA
jgi:large subunit ribosomal protein L31e